MGSNSPSSGEKQFSLAPFSRSMKYSGRREMNFKYISIQNSLEMQHLETAGLDAERRYLFGKNKPLGVKDFCSKLLRRSSKNTSG